MFKTIKGKVTRKDMYCKVTGYINKTRFCTKAIVDTGNFLKEPITQVPVIVVEKNILIGCIPEHILNNIDSIILGNYIDLEDYSSKIRIIPFTSLGKENGILLGLKGDRVEIVMDENEFIISNAIIGIYNGILSKAGKFHALIGLDVIEESVNNI